MEFKAIPKYNRSFLVDGFYNFKMIEFHREQIKFDDRVITFGNYHLKYYKISLKSTINGCPGLLIVVPPGTIDEIKSTCLLRHPEEIRLGYYTKKDFQYIEQIITDLNIVII